MKFKFFRIRYLVIAALMLSAAACAGHRVNTLDMSDIAIGRPSNPPVDWPTPAKWKTCAITKWYYVYPPSYLYSIPRNIMDIRQDRAVLLECVGRSYPFVLLDVDQNDELMVQGKEAIDINGTVWTAPKQ